MDNIQQEIKRVDEQIEALRMSVIIPQEKANGIRESLTRYRSLLTKSETAISGLNKRIADLNKDKADAMWPSQKEYVAQEIKHYEFVRDTHLAILSTLFPNESITKPSGESHKEDKQ